MLATPEVLLFAHRCCREYDVVGNLIWLSTTDRAKDNRELRDEISRLATTFEKCRQEKRAALIGYLPAGYPDLSTSIQAFKILIDAGCDIIEVGLPYSDPVMDGPTIQAAAHTALAGGMRVADVLTVVEKIAALEGNAVVMTYWNPVLRYGIEAFARDLDAAGGLGMITPDLIPEEAGSWVEASDQYQLDRIFLLAPSSNPQRIALTTKASRGFVYAASTMGVTGAREEVAADAPVLVSRIRQYSNIPIGVGLGVRSGIQAQQVARYANAVIVGSALVSALTQGPKSLHYLTTELAQAVRSISQEVL